MKKLYFILLLLALLFISACDRFDQDYIRIIKIEDFVANFQDETQSALANQQIGNVMAFYAENYFNNGMNKSAMQNFYTREWSENVMVSVNEIDADSMKYQIRITDTQLSVDTTWTDYAKKVNQSYYWYGNQKNPVVVPKQKVLVEVLTGLWCPNCPNAEHRLEEIAETIPDQMIMLNYHLSDSIAVSLSDCMYYGNTAPMVLFQGKTKLTGGQEDQLNQYLPIITGFITEDAQLSLTNVEFEKNGNTITGSVKINPFVNLDLSNTYLRAVVYEKETTATHFVSHEIQKNVVRARAMVDISSANLSNPISFTINSTKYISNDTYLVIWVQKNVDFSTINPSTDKVYNCIEVPINTKGVK